MVTMGRRSGGGERPVGEGKYLQDRVHDEHSKVGEIPYGQVAEEPLGPAIQVPYIGKTRMFSDHQMDVAQGQLGKGTSPYFLDHHVPLGMRGPYKVDGEPLLGERLHQSGYALCNATTQTHNANGTRIREKGNPCNGKAINRSGFCSKHGGQLCPLDRQVIDWEKAPREIRFKYGKLPVDELDDEELARGQIRKANGTFTKNKFVNAEIHDKMIQELFSRADVKLRENLVVAVETMAEIASGTAYEPADRAAAARWIYETVRGKTPTKVEIGVTKGFEQVLDAVLTGGSRDESRAKRGLENAIDAEVIDDEIDEDLDIPDLEPVEAVEVVEEVNDPEGDGTATVHDLEPKPIVHYGPAGKVTPDPHPSDEGVAEHHRREDKERRASEERVRDFSKKRKMNEEEIAKARKEHKDKMRAGLAKRKAFMNMGKDRLPENLPIKPVRWVDSEGEEIDLDDLGADGLEPGDELTFRVAMPPESKWFEAGD